MDTPSPFQQRALAAFPFLNAADAAFQRVFFEHGMRVELPAGQFICMEGNQCAHLPLVLSGTARVYKIAESGREITLYRINPGESCILTASCIVNSRDFPAFAVTEAAVEAVVIPAGELPSWFNRHEAWRAYLFDLLVQRLGSVIELVEAVAFRHMDARLAAYLLATTPPDGLLEKTHEAVAADLGTSREVVSRLLKDFEQDGLVALSRGVIRVRDEDGLAQIDKKT